MAEKIKSRNELFRGQEVDKPLSAKGILAANDEFMFVCPHCGETMSFADCDVIGAEPGCVFCLACNGEVEIQ